MTPPPFHPCFLVPLRNHSSTITALIDSLELYQVPCILVDDGSDQEAKALAQCLANRHSWVLLVCHERAIGRGAAVKTGLNYAYLKQFTHAFQIDVDVDYNLDDIITFLILARANHGAIICGDRTYAGPVSWMYSIGRRMTWTCVSVNMLSCAIGDPMCGFRVYPVPSIVTLMQTSRLTNRRGYDIEVLVRSSWQNLPIISQPIGVGEPHPKVSCSELPRFIFSMVWVHTRCWFVMLRRAPSRLCARLTNVLARAKG